VIDEALVADAARAVEVLVVDEALAADAVRGVEVLVVDEALVAGVVRAVGGALVAAVGFKELCNGAADGVGNVKKSLLGSGGSAGSLVYCGLSSDGYGNDDGGVLPLPKNRELKSLL
jgi:hypothetical protein